MPTEMKNKFIANIVSKMTLDQKVGAMMTLGFSGTFVRPHIQDAIQKFHCGGLRLTPGSRTFGSYVEPKSGKLVVNVEDTKGYKKGINAPAVTATEYKEILDGLQDLAMKRPLGIPLHFSFDQEGGSNADFFFGGVKSSPNLWVCEPRVTASCLMKLPSRSRGKGGLRGLTGSTRLTWISMLIQKTQVSVHGLIPTVWKM